tara:strand:- start:158 stop:2284 length:2127 start_codon:yes stop_codon:yes gene_type:complete
MSVNLEVKGTLAKLLATEDLLIEHKKVQTASFDVERRILTLPIWDLASNQVVDLLVSHEVGHALFTPNEDWTEKVQIPKNYVNVAEDVRVEKLMKRKYLGISKTFYRGYQELNQLDFFSVDGVDLDSMNLADRINLHFKIGAFLGIKFTPEEQEVVDVVSKAETFDDALAAAEVMYTFCKARAEEEKKNETKNQESGQVSEEGQSSTTQDSGESDSPSDDLDSDSTSNSGGASNVEGNDGDPDTGGGIPTDGTSVETMESLDQKMKDLISNNQYSDSHYLEIPEFPLDKLIVSNSFVVSQVNKFWDNVYEDLDNPFERIDAELAKFKKDASKEVNYLVKEFECRKSADSYARATTSRTGVLDTSKLHTYRYNEDLFKKVTTLPEGKSHGLVFLLDWSGSMGDHLLSTVKQVLNLAWFCQKVGIPFRVYAFTNAWYVERSSEYWEPQKNLLEDAESNSVWASDDFRLIEFLTSEGNAKDFEKQVKTLWRLTKANSRGYDNPAIPVGFSLSGTPLFVALSSLTSVLPAFQKKYGLQKVHTIVLTDGESEPLTYTSYRETRDGDLRPVRCQIRSKSTYLRDRKLGTTYSLGDYHKQQTSIMQNLRDRFPFMNFIGIRICSGRDFGSMVRWWTEQSVSPEMSSKWKKEKSMTLDIGNYTKFFAISAGDMGASSEFEVQNDATKSQIKSAFKKSLQKSKFNRKILSEFVELVA